MLEAPPHADRRPLLHWLIFTGASLFGAVLLWRYGLIRGMVASDRTGISSVIALLYLGTSLHCLWRIVVVAREGDAARHAAWRLGRAGGEGPAALAGPSGGAIGAFLRDLEARAARPGPARTDATPLLRSLAARLRGSNRFGEFASDTLMKLGLVGTIVGFIMMLAPVATIDMADRGTIRSSMNLMSDGMAVAMYTTLAGLVGSILVKTQYYLLDDATTKVLAVAVGLGERLLARGVEPRAEAAE
jgi:hypothetical protein